MEQRQLEYGTGQLHRSRGHVVRRYPSSAIGSSRRQCRYARNAGRLRDGRTRTELGVCERRLVATGPSRDPRGFSLTRSIADTATLDDVHDSTARTGLDVRER